MPGRPRTMANKVTKLESDAKTLALALYALIPEQYRDRPNPRYPLSQAWNQTLQAVTQAEIELEKLGKLLRAKAGGEIAKPTRSEIDQQRVHQ